MQLWQVDTIFFQQVTPKSQDRRERAAGTGRGGRERRDRCSPTASSMSCVTRSPRLIQQRAHIFHSLPFVTHVLIEALLVVFDIPCQIQFQLGIPAFLTSALHARITSPYSSQVTRPCFHPLQASFLCLSLARSSLLIHAGLLAFLPDFLLVGMDRS